MFRPVLAGQGAAVVWTSREFVCSVSCVWFVTPCTYTLFLSSVFSALQVVRLEEDGLGGECILYRIALHSLT